MRTKPVDAVERAGTGGSRVLLLIDAAGDRRVLSEWLSKTHEVIDPASDDALSADFDLCVLDDSAFVRTRKRIATRKRESEPVFLPFVLLTSAAVTSARRGAPTNDIDEVLEAPISPEMLVSRADVLLERRMREQRLAESRAEAMERMRTAQEHAQQELETTRLLLEAARTLAASLDLNEILTRLADVVLKSTGLTRAFVNLIDVDRQVLTPVVPLGGLAAPEGMPIPFDRLTKTSMQAITAKETAILDYELTETPEYDRKVAEANNSKLVLFVPLLVGGEIVGHIALDEPGERHQFSEREIELAQGVASQAAIVVKNAQLYEAERGIADRLQEALLTEERAARDALALNRINDAIHATLDFDEIMNRVLVEANTAFGSESASITVKQGDTWTVRYATGFENDIVGERIPDEQRGFMEAVERANEPMIIEDATKDPRLPPRWVQRFSFGSFLAVPLSVRGEMLGIMFFNFHREPSPIGDDKADFARKLSPTVSLALGNSRLYDIERESTRLSQALNAIDQDIHSTLATEEILARVVPAAANALGCESAAMGVREGDGWVVRHEYRLKEGLVGQRFSDDQLQVARRAADEQDVQIIDDASAHPGVNQETRRLFKAQSLLVVPLIAREEVVGVIYFIYHSRIHRFSSAEADFARRLSVSLGLAIVNARLFEAERDIADRLQEALLTLPDAVPGIEFAHAYHSATEAARVGGDFYDLFPLNHAYVGIVIGDVAGKGLDAAVLTSMVKNTIRAHANERGKTPSQILTLTNDVVYKSTPTEAFVTVFFGILDCRDGRLVYSNAGHTSAAVVGEGGSAGKLSATGPLLGAFEDVAFDQAETCLELDELLFLYTDGLTEARHDHELYGEERLFAFLATRGAKSARDVVEDVIGEVLTFTADRLRDDLALLAVKRGRHGAEMPQQQKIKM